MFILVFVACYLFWAANKPKAEMYYKIGIWILFVLTAFRHPFLNGDGSAYYGFFAAVPLLGDITGFESRFPIGYVYFVSLCKTLVNSYLFYQIVLAVISIFLLHKILKLLDLSGKEKCMYLFVMFCTFDFIWQYWTLMRQCLSNLIFAYFFLYYIKNYHRQPKIKNALALCLSIIIPPLFHTSGIFNLLILPIYFFLPKNDKKTTRFWVVLVLSIVLFLLGMVFVTQLSSFIVQVDERYVAYTMGEGMSANIINFVYKLIIFWLCCINYDRITYHNKNEMMNAYTISLLIGSVNFGIIGRLGSYFSFGNYTIQSFFKRFNKPMKNLYVVWFLSLMLIFVRYIYTAQMGIMRYYIFFWQEIDNAVGPDIAAFWKSVNI